MKGASNEAAGAPGAMDFQTIAENDNENASQAGEA